MKRLVIVALVLALVAPALATAAPAPPRQRALIEQIAQWIGGMFHPTAPPKQPIHIECLGSNLGPDGHCI